MQLDWGNISLPITVSVGLTRASSHDTLSSLLARADEALYRAKHGGRNQVVQLQAAEQVLAPAPTPASGELAGSLTPLGTAENAEQGSAQAPGGAAEPAPVLQTEVGT